MKPTLVVLAAGMGSRYGGVKQIDAVGKNNETLLDFATYDAMKSGFGKVVYIIRKDIEKDFRERLFDRVARNFDAEYVFQSHDSLLNPEQIALSANRQKPWGTVHALLCAEKAVSTPFAVINADDYYGREAFKTVAGHLSPLTNDATEHAIVCYILGNTLSKSGTVSRGVCQVKDGLLQSVKEHTKIGYKDSKIISFSDSADVEMTGNEYVSMNFFGLTPKVFESFHTYFDNFLAHNVSSEKAEAFLPEAVANVITNKEGSVKVYSSSEKWFGMTYPEDRALVKEEIAQKILEGYYPEILWEK